MLANVPRPWISMIALTQHPYWHKQYILLEHAWWHFQSQAPTYPYISHQDCVISYWFKQFTSACPLQYFMIGRMIEWLDKVDIGVCSIKHSLQPMFESWVGTDLAWSVSTLYITIECVWTDSHTMVTLTMPHTTPTQHLYDNSHCCNVPFKCTAAVLGLWPHLFIWNDLYLPWTTADTPCKVAAHLILVRLSLHWFHSINGFCCRKICINFVVGASQETSCCDE